MNRREFQQAMVASAAAGFTSSFNARPSRAYEMANQASKGQYFDFHTHIGRVLTNTQLTVGELLRWMDANDIAQAAVLPLASPES